MILRNQLFNQEIPNAPNDEARALMGGIVSQNADASVD